MFEGLIGDHGDRRRTHAELLEAATASFEADRRLFSEMRVAVRAYAGQFGGDPELRRPWDGRQLPEQGAEERRRNILRYSKNHIPRLADVYANEIIREAPDIVAVPVTGGDVKADPLAEMNNEVYEHHKRKCSENYRQKTDDDVLDFVVVGEAACKLYWDDQRDCVREETIAPYDLGRAPGSRSVEESPWHIHRHVYTKRDLVRMYGKKKGEGLAAGDPSTDVNHFGESSYTVFQSSKYEYDNLQGTMVLEYYERPTVRHPRGRYFFFTTSGIIEQGELPGGVYPIVVQRFMKTPRLARGHSFIRNIYRIQTEINRASGQDATNMAHFGDDKFVTNSNSDLQMGKVIKGATHLKVSGFQDIKSSFLFVEGKGQPKYVDYIQAQVNEMDYICHVRTQMEDKKGPQKGGDLSVVLYTQIKDKKRFVKYAQAFEDYLVTKGRRVLSLYRHYLTPGDVIHSGNMDKRVLVPDFKATSDRDFMFAISPANESDETRLGKQIVVDKIMQYKGQDLDKADIGMILRASMLSNEKLLLSHFSPEYDSWVNNQVELEKGIMPQVSEVEDFAYKARMTTTRMSKPDFKELPLMVQDLYRRFLQVCEEGAAKAENERLRIEQGVIPTEGALLNTDLYRTVPNSSGTGQKTERVKLPHSALEWLVESLQKQGVTQQNLAGLPASVQGGIMDRVATAAEQVGTPGGGRVPDPDPSSGAPGAPPPSPPPPQLQAPA